MQHNDCIQYYVPFKLEIMFFACGRKRNRNKAGKNERKAMEGIRQNRTS